MDHISDSKSAVLDRHITISYFFCLGLIVIFSIISGCLYIFGGVDFLKPEYTRDVAIDMMGMIICGLFVFSLIFDKPWNRQSRSFFRLIFSLSAMFFLDLVSSFMEGNSGFAAGIKLANTFEYWFTALLIYCYWSYIREELGLSGPKTVHINYFCRIVLVLSMMALILNWFLGFYFTVSDEGIFIYDKLAYTSEIPVFIIYLTILIAILRQKDRRLHEKIMLLTFELFPIAANIISIIIGDYALLNPAFLFSVVLIYVNVFSERSRKVAEQQALLQKQSMTLMISQIQPHFLYNTLTTISNLCVTDPEEAEETTVLFSQYLRTNLDSLRKTEPVPFKTELGHIRTYVELEKKRFGEKLNVEYNIEESDFPVPALGLQPIVENSIKHGIRGKDSPGHLYISSHKKGDDYEVIIEDDGVGFDPAAPAPDDGRSHVGMMNVRSRLEQMCGAGMTVESSPGNGCRTTVIFPGKK